MKVQLYKLRKLLEDLQEKLSQMRKFLDNQDLDEAGVVVEVYVETDDEDDDDGDE